MIISFISRKGGTGKSTAALHVAIALNERKNTLLIDADPNRSAKFWASRGNLPIEVLTLSEAKSRDAGHIVVDTQARPTNKDLEKIASISDLMVIPVTPDALSFDVLLTTIEDLEEIGRDNYICLLNIIPPVSRWGEHARARLQREEIPVLQNGIRRYVAFQKAVFNGIPVNQVKDPRAGIAWEDCQRVAKELETL